MEQLQRQQEAKLDGNLQEKQLLQTQFLFAQHAAAARANASRLDPVLFGRADGQMFQAAQHLNRADPELERDEEDDEDSEGPGDNDDVEEEGDEDEEEEEEEESGSNPQPKKPRLQPLPGYNFPPFTTSQSRNQLSDSPPSAVKQEPEAKEMLSPAGNQSFTSPNGLADWGYDESFKQVSCISIAVQSVSHSFLTRIEQDSITRGSGLCPTSY